MPLLTVIVVIVVVGILLHLVNRFAPMDATLKTILNWVVIIVLIVWLLSVFGVWSYLGIIKVPTVR